MSPSHRCHTDFLRLIANAVCCLRKKEDPVQIDNLMRNHRSKELKRFHADKLMMFGYHDRAREELGNRKMQFRKQTKKNSSKMLITRANEKNGALADLCRRVLLNEGHRFQGSLHTVRACSARRVLICRAHGTCLRKVIGSLEDR